MLKLFGKLTIGQLRNVGPPASAAIHSSGANMFHRKRKQMVATSVSKEDGTQGEKTVDIDDMVASVESKDSIFPDIDLPNRLFNGIAFKDLPICHIRVSKNNTIIDVTDSKGTPVFLRSAGCEGYKNTRKGTNIAAQAVATTIAEKALGRGWGTMRVVIRGLGPGRLSSIKALQMAGMDVVSITDATRISYNPPRPRKARRL